MGRNEERKMRPSFELQLVRVLRKAGLTSVAAILLGTSVSNAAEAPVNEAALNVIKNKPTATLVVNNQEVFPSELNDSSGDPEPEDHTHGSDFPVAKTSIPKAETKSTLPTPSNEWTPSKTDQDQSGKKEREQTATEIVATVDYEANQLSPELIAILKKSLTAEQLNSAIPLDVNVVFKLGLDKDGKVTGIPTLNETGPVGAQLADFAGLADGMLKSNSAGSIIYGVQAQGGEIHFVTIAIKADKQFGDYQANSMFTYSIRPDNQPTRQIVNYFPGLDGSSLYISRQSQQQVDELARTGTSVKLNQAVIGQTVKKNGKDVFVIVPVRHDNVDGALFTIEGFKPGVNLRGTPDASSPTNIVGKTSKDTKIISDRSAIDKYFEENPQLKAGTFIDSAIPYNISTSADGNTQVFYLVDNGTDDSPSLGWIRSDVAQPLFTGFPAPAEPPEVRGAVSYDNLKEGEWLLIEEGELHGVVVRSRGRIIRLLNSLDYTNQNFDLVTFQTGIDKFGTKNFAGYDMLQNDVDFLLKKMPKSFKDNNVSNEEKKVCDPIASIDYDGNGISEFIDCAMKTEGSKQIITIFVDEDYIKTTDKFMKDRRPGASIAEGITAQTPWFRQGSHNVAQEAENAFTSVEEYNRFIASMGFVYTGA